MTTDYSTLDTAALVAAAEEALKGVTPSAWGRDEEDDAAFIAAAPALVRALVARLREEVNLPPPCKFKVGDKVKAVNMRYGTGVDAERFPAGKVFTVTAVEYNEGLWQIETNAKDTTDWLAAFLESELEPVTNG